MMALLKHDCGMRGFEAGLANERLPTATDRVRTDGSQEKMTRSSALGFGKRYCAANWSGGSASALAT